MYINGYEVRVVDTFYRGNDIVVKILKIKQGNYEDVVNVKFKNKKFYNMNKWKYEDIIKAIWGY